MSFSYLGITNPKFGYFVFKPLSKLKLALKLHKGYLWLAWGIRGMRYFVLNNLMLLLLLLLLIQPVEAKSLAVVDDAFVCQAAAAKFERQYQIKKHLLDTISNVETGRWNQEHKQTLAWPWTINAQGKGQYFETKEEAVKAVKELQAKGVKSIDVGCMQINLMYHGDAFKNAEEALDPYKNVEYGAKYLKKLYARKGNDWLKAAMAYHSNVLKKALRYKKKIVVAYDRVKGAAQLAQAEIKPKTQISSPQLEADALSVDKAKTQRQSSLGNKAQTWRAQKLAEYKSRKSF